MMRRIDPTPSCLIVLLLSAAACPGPKDGVVTERRPDPESALAATNAARPVQTSVRGTSTGLEMDNSVGSAAQPAPAPIQCARGGVCRQLSAPISSGVDLLFVVDNSGSMRQEQESLREQFPRMIQMLTSGRRADGSTFTPAHDVHLGVVSTDMGIVGVPTNYPGCNGGKEISGGDDGLLQHPGGTQAQCRSSYPPFLAYTQGRDDPDELARDFGCIASLGTSGCGFEQPLESALKALWPKWYVDSNGTNLPATSNPVVFLSTTEEGRFGHGDTPPSAGNGGFARNDPEKGLSLLTVVVVSDEDDCSARDLGLFVSTNDPANPLSRQGINLRCFYNKQDLYALERYTLGLRGVRPNHEDTVRFAAIVGVPPDLVNADARAGVDFDDPASRDAYYDRILDDERMQEVPIDENVPALARIMPSCSRIDRVEQTADAAPPRRIVEVAKGFGRNGTVQSICQDDFGPAIDGVVDMMAKDVPAQCLPRRLKRNGGEVDCDVILEGPSLPPGCDAPYLSLLESDQEPQQTRCKLAQVPVHGGVVGPGEGFYYDDFSESERARKGDKRVCDEEASALISFTSEARPAPEVRVYLDCDKSAQK
jgi:hypothetical protein